MFLIMLQEILFLLNQIFQENMRHSSTLIKKVILNKIFLSLSQPAAELGSKIRNKNKIKSLINVKMK